MLRHPCLLIAEQELTSALHPASQAPKLILLNLICWFSAKPWSRNKYFTARELFFSMLRAELQHSSGQGGENLIASWFFQLFTILFTFWTPAARTRDTNRFYSSKDLINWDATRIPSSPPSALQVSKQHLAAEMQMGSRKQHLPQDRLLIFNVTSEQRQAIRAPAEFATGERQAQPRIACFPFKPRQKLKRKVLICISKACTPATPSSVCSLHNIDGLLFATRSTASKCNGQGLVFKCLN